MNSKSRLQWVPFFLWSVLFVVHGWLDLVPDDQAMYAMIGLVGCTFFLSTRYFLNFALILVFTAILQLLIAPHVSLEFGSPFSLSKGVTPEAYFRLVFLGVYALGLGVLWPVRVNASSGTALWDEISSWDGRLLKQLFILILVLLILAPWSSQIPVVGAVLEYISKGIYILTFVFYIKKDWHWFFASFALISFRAITSSYFFEPGIFFLMFIMLAMYLSKMKWTTALFVLVLVGFVLPILQEAKSVFRSTAFTTEELTVVERARLFYDSFTNLEHGTGGEILTAGVTLRLNQGLYDSFVYENGIGRENTIVPALFSVIIPRTIWPDKPGFDSRKLRKFGNYNSMGSSFFSISQVCESYLSWGKWGGVIFLFLYGLMLRWILVYCAFRGGAYVVFLPLIFIHVLRIEVDFVHVFSSLIHGGLAYWLINRKLGNLNRVRAKNQSLAG